MVAEPIEFPSEDQGDPWRQVLARVRRDLRAAAVDMSIAEVRFLVDQYYTIQDFRIQATGQSRALDASGEPHLTTAFVGDGMIWIEESIKAVMDRYTRSEPTGMGAWARGVVGIGPVLSAGLLANVDIAHCVTVGHLWSFAGLNPTATWDKGQKRPWNARLKVLCWKIGESFVKQSGHKDDIYGKVYLNRKVYEQTRNDSGALADQAKTKLERFKIGKDTDAYAAYSAGKLPPAHIHARAKRYAVKAFLADWWSEYYRRHHGTEPPLPYPLAHLGHAHYREGKGWLD
jgi:hypothetical protein